MAKKFSRLFGQYFPSIFHFIVLYTYVPVFVQVQQIIIVHTILLHCTIKLFERIFKLILYKATHYFLQ